jgi:hypothetical protein
MLLEDTVYGLHITAKVGRNILGQLKLDVFYPPGRILAIIYHLRNTLRNLGGSAGQNGGRRG